jgi:hypothetical protein
MAVWTTPTHGQMTAARYNPMVADNLTWLHDGSPLYLPSDPSGDLTGVPKARAPVNGALCIPVINRDSFTATSMGYRSDTADGKIDLGIYLDDGNGLTISKIATTGLTLMPSGAGPKQIALALPAVLKPLKKYWLVMGMAITVSGSGGAVGAVLGTTGVLLPLCKRAVNCMPLPTVITFDTVAPACSPCLAAYP